MSIKELQKNLEKHYKTTLSLLNFHLLRNDFFFMAVIILKKYANECRKADIITKQKELQNSNIYHNQYSSDPRHVSFAVLF